MMNSTETSLIIFEGSFVPSYVLYYQAEYRCHLERPKAQFCQRCRNIGHRNKDVCTSTELCQTFTPKALPSFRPAKIMIATPPAATAKALIPAPGKSAPGNLKATPRSPNKPTAANSLPANQTTSHHLLRKHRTSTVRDPGLAIAIQAPRSESTTDDKI
ncbi:hypothetical protein HPB48_015982 [Haemaphysalis longicornis]|uniref:Uncharacterized protein n=1 Tax=Haemaphysalis longicornis TaxID=44386 RepID=A0A9J6GD69_HAELO|nr:hypothetical protein HPB48_015982 [Haemaphysalis longicornis]